MMKRFPFYPYLFILYAILTPLIYNLGEVDPALALRPLVVLLLVSTTIMLLLYVVFKDWQYAAYLVFLVLAFFFLSAHLSRFMDGFLSVPPQEVQQITLVLLGGILLVLAFKQVWSRLGGPERAAPALNFILVVALISQVIFAFPKIVKGAASLVPKAEASVLPETGNLVKLDCSQRPDIYYIILDGYGRSDVLESVYGVDNQPFLQFLEQKGFVVADQGHSNYIQTIYSIASSLNFDYIDPEPPGMSGQQYFTQLIEQNRLVKELKGCGYETYSFETGFFFTNHLQVDDYLSSGNRLNEFEGLLLAGTPLESLGDKLNWKPPEFSYQAHRNRVRFDLDQLSRLPLRRGPKFVFAHIVSPHPPFVFDAQGNPIQPNRDYSIGDGSDYAGSWEEYRKGYAGQVQFVDRELEKVIENILARSPTPPIIILQGDHGPGGHLDWGSPDDTCLWERTSILNAYYLPDGGTERLFPSITPVNTFRVVQNAYFGTDLPLVSNKTYFTSHQLPRQVIDITDERNSHANCP